MMLPEDFGNIPKRAVPILLVITLITQELDSFRLPLSQATSSAAIRSNGASVSGLSGSSPASISHTESPAITKSPSSSSRISSTSSGTGSTTLSTPISKSNSVESVIPEMADRSSITDLILRGVSESADEPTSCISHDGRWGNTCGVKKRDVRGDGDLVTRLHGIQNYINDTIETFLLRQYIKDGFIREKLRHAKVAVFSRIFSGNNYREKLTSLMKTLYAFVANVDYLRLCGLSAVAEPTLPQQLNTLTTMVFESLCTCETSAGSKGFNFVAPPAASLVSKTLRDMVKSGASEMRQVQTAYLVVRDMEAVIREVFTV